MSGSKSIQLHDAAFTGSLVSVGARSYRSISAVYAAGAQQQTRRPPLLLSIDRTDRRTDRRTDGRTDGRTPDRCIYAPLRILCMPRVLFALSYFVFLNVRISKQRSCIVVCRRPIVSRFQSLFALVFCLLPTSDHVMYPVLLTLLCWLLQKLFLIQHIHCIVRYDSVCV